MKKIVAALFAVTFATVALADGAATYKAKCAMCHGEDAKGGEKKMAKAPIAGMPEAAVLKAISEGKGKMKAVKIDDAADVAKYVAGLK